jgi:hypothetical protein
MLLTVAANTSATLWSTRSDSFGSEIASLTPMDRLAAAAYCADAGKLAVAAGSQVCSDIPCC